MARGLAAGPTISLEAQRTHPGQPNPPPAPPGLFLPLASFQALLVIFSLSFAHSVDPGAIGGEGLSPSPSKLGAAASNQRGLAPFATTRAPQPGGHG